MPRPDYGLDAPVLARNMFAGGVAAAALGAAAAAAVPPPYRWAAAGLRLTTGVYLLGMSGLMVYWSKVAKLRERDRLLDDIPWTGREAVLDVGCGRGLMAIGAAARLTTGRAVGADLWVAVDQSGNGPGAFAENARRAGVADKVEAHTADMRDLPFPDAAFDVVVSHWAVHNLPGPADRAKAVGEMARVLKPGGRLVLADIEHHTEYAGLLAAAGLADVRRVGGGLGTAALAAVSFGSFRPEAVTARKP